MSLIKIAASRFWKWFDSAPVEEATEAIRKMHLDGYDSGNPKLNSALDSDLISHLNVAHLYGHKNIKDPKEFKAALKSLYRKQEQNRLSHLNNVKRSSDSNYYRTDIKANRKAKRLDGEEHFTHVGSERFAHRFLKGKKIGYPGVGVNGRGIQVLTSKDRSPFSKYEYDNVHKAFEYGDIPIKVTGRTSGKFVYKNNTNSLLAPRPDVKDLKSKRINHEFLMVHTSLPEDSVKRAVKKIDVNKYKAQVPKEKRFTADSDIYIGAKDIYNR